MSTFIIGHPGSLRTFATLEEAMAMARNFAVNGHAVEVFTIEHVKMVPPPLQLPFLPTPAEPKRFA